MKLDAPRVYLDTAALLRGVFRSEKTRPQVDLAAHPRRVSSVLLRVELRRKLDRLQRAGVLTEDEAREAAERVATVELVELDAGVVERAAEDFGAPLGTLDALHLSTALRLRAAEPSLVLATTDSELWDAARKSGLAVLPSVRPGMSPTRK